jgi:large subunit ribosomal protein L6
MSRIGKQPVAIPTGVDVKILADSITVKGPKGSLSQHLVGLVDVKVENNEVICVRQNDSKPARANHGLIRSLISNMVDGVTQGFSKKLEVNGVGYRADVKGKNLVMNLGYSHPIEYSIPEGITIEVDKQNNITVSGCDKQQVGQVAAKIRSYREPDHYKGKGVRYSGEYVRIKAGKSAK